MNKLLSGNPLWSIGLFETQPGKSVFDQDEQSTIKLWSTKKFRTQKKHVHTLADPFLYVRNNSLYIFHESQAVGEKGSLNVLCTDNLETFDNHKLQFNNHDNFHFSYPFIFEDGSEVYLLPESSELGEVAIYEFLDFPIKISKKKTILRGNYYDSSIHKIDNTWYLFTTSDNGLEIYYSDSLFESKFNSHPLNPIEVDPRYSRNGGGLIVENGNYFRISQDCSESYGSNVNFHKIVSINSMEYEEEVIIENFFQNQSDWNANGGHHFSCANFQNKRLIVIDGKQNDYLLNKLISPIFKVM